MNGATIRTTVNFPVHRHRQLKLEAVQRGTTMSDVVLQKMGWRQETTVDDDLAFFEKLRKSGRQINAVKAIRETREERARQLAQHL